MSERPDDRFLGLIDWDRPAATSERATLRAPEERRPRILRNALVRIDDPSANPPAFLGRIVAGPFFPGPTNDVGAGAIDGTILAEVELQGELVGGRPRDTSNRPAPGAAVYELEPEEVCDLLGFSGDLVLGHLTGRPDLPVCLGSANKDVLPRNLGIFGTVGSGKSNTTQVIIEEAAARGWAVILLDVEGEYVEMDAPSDEDKLFDRLALSGRSPGGLADFHVLHPASCASERPDSQPFTVRLADFETGVIAEILQASLPERNALLECVDHFEQRARTKVVTSEKEALLGLLDPSPQARLPFTVRHLRERAGERSGRSSEFVDYQGLATKLLWLIHSGAFDQPNIKGLDPAGMMQPGRVTVLDVSVANDVVKNLVTADLLRKTFAYKIAHADAPPTLLVIEEAHSFISREKVHTMQATLQMLRNVSRRGRKRWLSVAFVSQQPGHLPPEIFELCNTRLVHTLRSTHNLDALIATTGDMTREMWARCPLLGTGEAVVSSPQLRRPVIVSVRPASSRRKYVR
jgi:DNA helicase HerA-like ATPase